MNRNKRYRDISRGCCLIVFFGCGLAALGDLTSNQGLWSLGGSVGPSRWAIAWAALLAVAVFALAQAMNGNGVQPVAPDSEQKRKQTPPLPFRTLGADE